MAPCQARKRQHRSIQQRRAVKETLAVLRRSKRGFVHKLFLCEQRVQGPVFATAWTHASRRTSTARAPQFRHDDQTASLLASSDAHLPNLSESCHCDHDDKPDARRQTEHACVLAKLLDSDLHSPCARTPRGTLRTTLRAMDNGLRLIEDEGLLVLNMFIFDLRGL